MAHFAKIDNDGNVLEVHVINNVDIDGGAFPESEALGQAWQASHGIEGNFVQCSFSGSFRGAYPGPGWTWKPNKKHKDGGLFIGPPPGEMPDEVRVIEPAP
jgi:hypothetical protein